MAFTDRLHNRGSISTELYQIENSLKLEPDNAEYLTRTVSTTGNRKIGTISIWLKRTEICESVHQYTGAEKPQWIFEQGNTDNDSGRIFARFGGGSANTGDEIQIQTGSTVLRQTNRSFRDTTAWYHIVLAIDTTQATADDRIKLYINGIQETSFQTTNNFSQNADTGLNYQQQTWGRSHVDSGGDLAGYISEAVMVDGSALGPASFGRFDISGIWVPKDVSSLSLGTNGSYMKFENASSMGTATSGNNFTATNISSADQATDTPTNVFCNYFDKAQYTNNQVAAEAIFRRGNTWFETTRASGRWRTAVSNWGVTQGKWYAEFSANTSTFMIGVGSYDKMDGTLSTTTERGAFNTHLGATDSNSIGFYSINGRLYENGTQTLSWGLGYNANDILAIALDMDNGYVYFRGGSTWQNSGDPTSGSSGTGGVSLPYYTTDTYYMGVSLNSTPTYARANWGGYTEISIASSNTDANGYGNFEYSVPTGYYAMCTKNLAEFG
jgi:hypothetical protein